MQARLFHQLVLRYITQHRVIALFDFLSIAIGVAVYLAIQTANHSANQAFKASIDLVAGKSHLEVVGVSSDCPEEILPIIMSHPEVVGATPVIEAFATLPNFPGRYLHLVGSEVFSAGPFETVGAVAAIGGGSSDLEAWITVPNQVLIHENLAETLGKALGDSVLISIDGKNHDLALAGIIPTGLSDQTALAVMDIGWLQELRQSAGRVTSIQVLVADPSDLQAVSERLKALLPTGVRIQTPKQRSEQVQRMLAGFQLNITALSMVSVLVGIFLIYNSVSASVVRRRREIGILRSNGASKPQILSMFLGEGLMLGIPGVAFGIPLGIFLSKALVGQVAGTISSHYLAISVDHPTVAPHHVYFAIGFGIFATLAGALLPAIEAARIPPLQALRPNRAIQSNDLPLRKMLLSGILLLIVSATLCSLALTQGPAWLSFGACFVLVVGFSLISPWICEQLGRLTSWLCGADGPISLLIRLAAENLRRSLHRSSVTVAALMLAVSMTIGVMVMVTSFRITLDSWVHHLLKADLYIAPAANEIVRFQSFLPPEAGEFFEQQPSVQLVETYRQETVEIEEHTFVLGAVGNPSSETLHFMGGRASEKMNAFARGGSVLVTEPLFRRLGFKEGDTIHLPTPAGEMSYRVAGVYYDYTDDRGKVVIPISDFVEHWGDDRIHSIAVFFDPDLEPGGLEAEFRNKFASAGELAIYSNTTLRERIFEIFDDTFAVTYVLKSIAVLVAILGVGLALATLVMERTREIGIFRAIGASQGQVRTAYLVEAGLLGLFSSIIGIVCGLGMAVILTFVVNKAFFGWTIDLNIPWLDLLVTPLWVVPVAIIAGLLPANYAARSSVNSALRTGDS